MYMEGRKNMTEKIFKNNQVVVAGEIISDFEFSHDSLQNIRMPQIVHAQFVRTICHAKIRVCADFEHFPFLNKFLLF